MPTSAAPGAAVLGIDLGSSKTMCVLSDGQIIRNELGGISTASIVGFQGGERFLGEAAVAQARANAKNTVLHLPRLLGKSLEEVQTKDGHLSQYYMHRLVGGGPQGDEVAVEVDYNGQPTTFSPTVLLAMLLGKIKGYTAPGSASDGVVPVGAYAIVVPKGYTPQQAQVVIDAAKVAGLDDVIVTHTTDALLTAYRAKHPAKEFQPGEVKNVLVVEMGHSQTSCVMATCRADTLEVLAEETALNLGCANFDHRLFQHFKGVVEKKYKEAVLPGTKKGFRLMGAMERLRKLLSTIPEAHVQAENVVENQDVNLSLRKEEFASVVMEEVNQFKALIQGVIEK